MTKKLSRVSGHVILILLSFLALFPIYWMIISSLKSSPEIFGYSMITTQRLSVIILTLLLPFLFFA